VLKEATTFTERVRNSHINLKKRRICTVRFYEDLTVCIILKNLYHIKKLYWIKILYFRFPIRLGLHCFIRLGLHCFRSKKRLHYFRGVEFVRQRAILDGNMCSSIRALPLTFAVYQSQIRLVGFAALNLTIA